MQVTVPRPTRSTVVGVSVVALAVVSTTVGLAVPPPSLGATPTSANISASPTTVTYPSPTRVSGKLLDKRGKGVSNATVRIEFKRASATTWSTATNRTTGSDGSYSWSAQLSGTSQLRTVFDGTRSRAASTSHPVTVQVRAVIGFNPVYVTGQGQKTRLGGSVSPSTPGRSVVLEYLNGNSWHGTGMSTKVDNNGQWGVDVTYTTFGDRTLRAQLASGTDQLGSTSPQRTIRVTYQFQTVVSTGGKARVDISRPDAPGGGCTIGIGRIIAGATKIELHPGSQDPGGTWQTPDSIPANQRAGAVAAFNGGFLMKASRGGFYLEGKEAYPLNKGAASVVPVSDGTWRLGTWGRDVSAGPRVVSVRQNLELMVDNSQVLPTVDSNIQSRWGATFSNATNTWRSGLGIDPAGNLVYVMGPCLSPRQVAQALVHAGAVRGMQLDVNVYWPTFDYYTASSPTSPIVSPHKLLSNEHNPADHYFWSGRRDFFSVRLR